MSSLFLFSRILTLIKIEQDDKLVLSHMLHFRFNRRQDVSLD